MVVVLPPYVKYEPIKVGDVVHFSPNWSPTEIFGDKYFRVRANLLKRLTKSFVLNSGSTYNFVLNDDSGLLPQSATTMYEIMVGMKGHALLYIMWPESDYLFRLEKTGFQPNPTEADKRYIGHLLVEEIGLKEPKLILYTTQKMDTINLRFYNDTDSPQKIVLVFHINHIKLETTSPPSGAIIREIKHWRDIREEGLY